MKPETTKYHITEHLKPDGLAGNVERLMEQGWEPIGGVATETLCGVAKFYQAMVKYV